MPLCDSVPHPVPPLPLSPPARPIVASARVVLEAEAGVAVAQVSLGGPGGSADRVPRGLRQPQLTHVTQIHASATLVARFRPTHTRHLVATVSLHKPMVIHQMCYFLSGVRYKDPIDRCKGEPVSRKKDLKGPNAPK